MSTCLRQHTHACAPMEPLYGSAVVAIPSLTAFLAFGGRAAVDMVDDFSECSERLGRLAWRFQYHTQLTDSVQLDINGSTVGVAHPHHAAVQQPETTDLAILTRDCVSMLSVNADYHCLNQPIVGLLNTAQEPGGEHTSHPHSTTSTFEPAAHAYGAGMHVEWARLIPFGMSDESMQQLLHRSHHAMVPIQTAMTPGQVHPKLFLLWGGYGENMAVLNDMWAVYVYDPGSCTALEHAAASWWVESWCFTSFQIRQTGAIPAGRAYAKLAVLQVDHSGACLVCFHPLAINKGHIASVLVQDRQEVLLYGGCQVCSGDSGIEDPSGSDSLETLVLDISHLPALPQPGTADWSVRHMLGTPLIPARKGHALMTHGCSPQAEADATRESSGHVGPCSVLWFGGWNPRWPTADSGHLAVQKLDTSLWAWSRLPHEGMKVKGRKLPGATYLGSSHGASDSEHCVQDEFEESVARTQPSAICALGNSHFLVMAAYLWSPLIVPLPVEHVASIDSMPWLLTRAYAGAALHHAQWLALHDVVH